MVKYLYEYRINKKGCECFRSKSREAIAEKLEALKEKHPNTVYTVQSRSIRLSRGPLGDWLQDGFWTPWFD